MTETVLGYLGSISSTLSIPLAPDAADFQFRRALSHPRADETSISLKRELTSFKL